MKKLTRMKLINWHRFTNEMIDFENSVLISGENGAGKSTMLDAIQFVVTCSANYFNKAAHENGKRKLAGYIRCKTGRENRPYERTGEISAHIALEFYEEQRQRYFIIGAVVDSAAEGQEKTVRYLMDGERLDDTLFFQGKTPKSISQFRTSNGKKIKTWCTTEKDAKQMVKNRFGRLEDKFFKLIPKAMAFRPIDDIKDFVYSYVLDKKDINIEILRENVRTYQELQRTLDNIKLRMGRLEKIEGFHRQVEEGMQKDQMYEYFLDRIEVDILTEEIKRLESMILHDNYRLESWNKEIDAARKEKTEKQEIRDTLFTELANDKDFIARDEQTKKLQRLEDRQAELYQERKQLMESVGKAKVEVNRLLKVPDTDACIREYSVQLEQLEKTISISEFKDTLSQVFAYKNRMSEKVYKRCAELEMIIRDLAGQKKEWDLKIENLMKKKLSYPEDVTWVVEAIREEFIKIGRSPEPRILCEMLEITDETWRNAVEGYLNTQRFYILVEPDHFDIALGTYDRLRREKRTYGVGLINTQNLEKYDTAPEGSLAAVVTSGNKYAKRYINMVLGKVMMCDHYSHLKNYKTAITKECMRYQNHAANAIKPAIFETPYIGKNAVRVQLEQAKIKSKEIDGQLDEKQNILQNLEELQKPLSTETDTDIKYQIDVLADLNSVAQEIKSCKDNIATLEKNSGMILKQNQLFELKDIIEAIGKQIEELIGNVRETKKDIEYIKGNLADKNTALIGQKSICTSFAAEHEKDIVLWDGDYEKQLKDKSYEQFRDNYVRRRKANQTTIDKRTESMKNSMMEYKTAHDFGAAATLEGYLDFEAEYMKLKNSELLNYEEKVENARQSAEEEFREQFLAKLQENMKNAQMEFKELNKALKDIRFSNEKYEFLFMPSKRYRHYYEMIMDDFNAVQGESIFSGLFHESHKEVIDELFERLALDNDNSAKVLDEFTDYRTYMDYDIRIIHSDDSHSLYSKVCEEKSGGETQTPFYVTVAASFVQLYRNGIGGEAAGLVMFDEAFNNMDDERIGGVLEFLRRLPLQILIAAPPDKIQYISPFVEETLLIMTDEKVSYAERYYNGAV
ncbi:MAG: AAA family ATPase [Blautia sp.]|nr:AAA family ATPase [Lachnoclostridium sp.]MCM1210020.1 AAA family ATPase [Blautia sp.]